MQGFWEYFHSNGQLSSKGKFKNGNQLGYWEYFNKDGTVNEKYTGTYKYGLKVSD